MGGDSWHCSFRNTPAGGFWIQCSIASDQNEIILQISRISRLSVILSLSSNRAFAVLAALRLENAADAPVPQSLKVLRFRNGLASQFAQNIGKTPVKLRILHIVILLLALSQAGEGRHLPQNPREGSCPLSKNSRWPRVSARYCHRRLCRPPARFRANLRKADHFARQIGIGRRRQ